ncbi:hypothetical protein E2C01_044338 [Portunus trituberculatus]|uniref:Uncharacterized protein n=1 Tax=Portunus trituberculatus TaxID=210409 RepID=A0A5B7FZ18_PORTR|nr:hypothetical protein [Portunus trituberculatus]
MCLENLHQAVLKVCLRGKSFSRGFKGVSQKGVKSFLAEFLGRIHPTPHEVWKHYNSRLAAMTTCGREEANGDTFRHIP